MATRKAKSKRVRKTRQNPPKRGTRRAASARPSRQDPQTLRLREIQTGFTVNDLERSIHFYTEILGFIVAERWTAEDGQLRGVMLRAGACELGLSQDDWAQGRDRKKGVGMRLWCTTAQDIDALSARIEKAGGRLTERPRNQPWGGRSFSVEDPDGFRFTIYKES